MNNLVIAVLVIFFILYNIDLVKMRLPVYIKNLFNNPIFRIVFLSALLVFQFDKTPCIALIISLIFVMTLDYLNYEKVKENMDYLESYMLNNKN
jgi:hypothetical protein